MSNQSPASWAMTLLKWICPKKLQEGIVGDLLEQFEEEITTAGRARANKRFIWNVLRLLHPSILLRNQVKKLKYINMRMFRSHFLVAYRSMMKYKLYSFINVFGLSTGAWSVCVIFLFVNQRLSVDSFHENTSIYRIYSQFRNAEAEGTEYASERSAIISVPLTPELARQTPSITKFTRVASNSGTVVQNQTPYEEIVHFVDKDFLSIFSFPIISGSENSLNNPNTIVLSSEHATKYFGDVDPIGKTLELTLNDSTQIYEVTGVVMNMKHRASLQFDILVPFETFRLVAGNTMTSYTYSSIEGYVVFENPDVLKGISPVLTSAIARESENDARVQEIGIQPLSEIHIETDIEGNAEDTDLQKLRIVSALGSLILLVAIINFITLSTSHTLKRLREVGLRKTLGAFKTQIGIQFITESFFVSALAGMIGLAMAYWTAPYFSQVFQVPFVFVLDSSAIIFVLLLITFIALVSGGIQSILLTRYKPVDAIRGTNMVMRKDSILNQSLVVLQFTLSTMLIIGTLVMKTQMEYIQNKDLGYDKERLLEIGMQSPSDITASNNLLNRFRLELDKDPRILSVSAAMNSFKEPWTRFEIRQEDDTEEEIYFNKVDEKYVKTMGMKIVRGADFEENSSNSTKILVNEAMVRHFEWEDPLSEQIPGVNYSSNHQIIGVVKDFHYGTLHEEIEPLVLSVDADAIIGGVTGLATYVWPINMYTIVLRIGPGDLGQVLAHIEDTWTESNPGQPFVYSFVDDVLAKNYTEEARWQKMIDLGSIFSLLIAWLGLLGLTKLSVQKRVKEIGIRKVLGSSVSGISKMLSRKFLLLLVLSNVIAWPLAWLVTQRWLEQFAYRITVGPLIFLAGGIGVLLVALSSVGYQSFKAAASNPVDALKCE